MSTALLIIILFNASGLLYHRNAYNSLQNKIARIRNSRVRRILSNEAESHRYAVSLSIWLGTLSLSIYIICTIISFL